MKKIQCLVALAVFFCLLPLTVYAGDINEYEQQLLDWGSGVFYYNGKEYVATEDAKAKARAKFMQDDVDVAASQVQELKNQFWANFSEGIAQGYLVCITPDPTPRPKPAPTEAPAVPPPPPPATEVPAATKRPGAKATPTPEPTVEPTPEPTLEPSPSPTPTASPTPSPTPEPTPSATPHRDYSGFDTVRGGPGIAALVWILIVPAAVAALVLVILKIRKTNRR